MIGGAAMLMATGGAPAPNPYLVGCVGLWNLGGTLASAADLSGNGKTANIADNGGGNIATTTLGGRAAVSADGAATAARYNLGSIASSDPLSLVGASVATIIFRVAGPGAALTTSFPRIIDKSDGGLAQNGWAIWVNTTTFPARGIVWQIGGGSSMGSAANAFETSSAAQTYGVEMRPTGASASHRLYRGGALIETITGTLATPPTTTTNAALLNWNHSTSRMWQGSADFVGVWTRELSASEHAAIHADPSVLGI